MTLTNFKIYVDMDGVLTDWEKQFLKYTGMSIQQYNDIHGETTSHNFVHKHSPDFYSTLDWMKDGKVLHNFIKHLPTSILSHASEVEGESGKLKWIERNGISFKPIFVKHKEDKSNYATPDSILIDDKPENVDGFTKAGGIGIVHTNATDTINKLKEIIGIKQKYRIYNSILNPEFWTESSILKPDILDGLIKIAQSFYKDSELTIPMVDVYFLGSSAGYNWTPTSDMDLHIIVDVSKLGSNAKLNKKYIDGLKSKWNNNHDIKIGNHSVELYIQDINEENRSQAVYSLFKNKWIKMPLYKKIHIDKVGIIQKYTDLKTKIDKIIEIGDLNALKLMVKKLYNMRETGLSTGGEFSNENLVFKLLRHTNYITKINSKVKQLVDLELTM